MRHPFFESVIQQIELQFQDNGEFRRRKRDPWEVAEFRQHVAQVARWTADEAAQRIAAGNYSILEFPDQLIKAVRRRVAAGTPWHVRWNPLAQRLLKRATLLAVKMAVTYLRARFPVLSLVSAAAAAQVMRDIAKE